MRLIEDLALALNVFGVTDALETNDAAKIDLLSKAVENVKLTSREKDDVRRVLWNSLAPLLPPLPESSSDLELSETEKNPAGKPTLKSTDS